MKPLPMFFYVTYINKNNQYYCDKKLFQLVTDFKKMF